MTSQKQIAANKENAKKAGVKTAAGKAVSRLNATKHGILSRQVFIVTGREEIDETHGSFLELKDAFWNELQPVGIVEEVLVDRLFSTVWRLKRFLAAESGVVERQIDSHHFRDFLTRLEQFCVARQTPQTSFFARLKMSMGCREMAQTMEHVARTIKAGHGFPLPDWVTGILDKRIGAREGFPRTEHLSVLDYAFRHRDENPISPEEEKEVSEEATQEAAALAEWFTGMAEILEWIEKDEERASLKIKLIPPAQELEKLQRYEAHLQRVFLQTLHELQRVQSTRMGQPAPLAAALDLTLDTDRTHLS